MKKTLTIFALLSVVFGLVKSTSAAENKALIYYNEACSMCADYIGSELPEDLKNQGVQEFEVKDYVSIRQNRTEMNELMTSRGVPLLLQSHIMTFVGDKFVLGGHIPGHVIEDIFDPRYRDNFEKIIVYQDEMHGEAKDYKVWAVPAGGETFAGEIRTYPIDARVTQYLNSLPDMDVSGTTGPVAGSALALLPIVLGSAFLDGINPCAFAVLLFFIAFLFSIKRTRAGIWKMGAVYIFAIFLAYFLIGLGLLKAVMFSNSPHFMAQLGAWLVIGLGTINIVNHFFPRFPVKLRIPHASKDAIKRWTHKATLPAAFVLGFLVGLCTFPCSGGIYVAIIGLLASQTTYWGGLGYLVFYNVMFVMPLVVILLLAANKYAVNKITAWEQSESRRLKLLSAGTMIALGIVILVWFT